MKRRDFLRISAIAALWPAAARTQPASGPRIAVLMPVAEADPEGIARVEAFEAALSSRGRVAGQNLDLTYRWAAGSQALMAQFAAEVVSLAPDLILVQSNEFLAYVARETTTIPIIVAIFSDPLGSGLVASLAKPGGNVTGFANLQPEMAEKWIELLLRIAPSVTRIGVLLNPNIAANQAFLAAAIATAPSFGVVCVPAPMRDAAEIDAALAGFHTTGGGGLIVLPNPQIQVNRDLLLGLIDAYRLPAIHPFRFMVEAGGLISYGIDIVDVFERAAGYVDRVLDGEPVGQLPVQLPESFELAVNLSAAAALGLTVPPSVLALATRVIE